MIEKDVIDYINSFYTPLTPQLKELREESEEKKIPIILKETENTLTWLLKEKQPRRILEIGTAVGYSSIYMANLLPECEITTIEKFDNVYYSAVRNISKFGLEHRIDAQLGDAREILEEIGYNYKMGIEKPFDLVFIDAAKSFYREFWDLTIPMVKQDGLIVCDNILMRGMTVSEKYDKFKKHRTSMKKMREFLTYINGIENVTTTITALGDGLSISTIKDKK